MNRSTNQETNKYHEKVLTPKQEPETMIYNTRFTTSIWTEQGLLLQLSLRINKQMTIIKILY